MAITNNPVMQGVSGSIGKEIVFKKYYGKTVVSKMPDMSRRVLSAKQVESNERMRLANYYAKAVYRSSEEEKLRARLRLKLPAHKSLYHALVKEHLDQIKNLTLDEAEKKTMDIIRSSPPSP